MFYYIVYYLFSWIWTSERFRSFLPLVGITGPSDSGNEVALIEQSPESQESQEDALLGGPVNDLEEIAFVVDGTNRKPSNPFHQPVNIEVSIKACIGKSAPLGKTVRGTLMVPQPPPKPTTTLCTVPPPRWGLVIPGDTLSVAIMLIWIFAMVWFRLLPKLTSKKRAGKMSHKSVQTGNDKVSIWIYRDNLDRILKKRKIPGVLCEDDLAKKIKSHMDAFEESSSVITAEELLVSLAQFRQRMAQRERNANLEEHQPMDVDEYPDFGQMEDGARDVYYDEEGAVEFLKLELGIRNMYPDPQPEDLNVFYDFLPEIEYFYPDFRDFSLEIEYFYPDFCDFSQEYPHFPEDFLTDYEDVLDNVSLDDLFSIDENAAGDGMMKTPPGPEMEPTAAEEEPPRQVPDVQAEAEAPEEVGGTTNQVLWHLESGLQYVVNCQVLSDEDCQLEAEEEEEDTPKDDQGPEPEDAPEDPEEVEP
ncbi:uncharacterized protein Dana_GF26960 [Drosophila ananassae]|uniref:Uncharacterized protein n=1 Tax=Drosophila ananassae TaxID=7217 RepID=A0A0P8XXF9_DROAN|nr:uncharacterized protein LOC26514369 isoform X1 [Drosophila ananassae]KPU74103.1 uncharacterized protein Dana_GF26960 [Drosophila ananassae]